jgi:5-methylcytosine-specific restriction endonuclease McrA
MKRALLLNADYSPLHFISDIDAVILVFKGSAEIICRDDGKLSVWDDVFVTASNKNVVIPATLKLVRRVNKRWKAPRFRRKVLFNRDNWKCQYCAAQLNRDAVTIEHVMPSSRGGPTSWKNCVTACKPCNKKKANKTPDEANMKLLKTPAEPSTLHFWDAARSSVWHEDWSNFCIRGEN